MDLLPISGDRNERGNKYLALETNSIHEMVEESCIQISETNRSFKTTIRKDKEVTRLNPKQKDPIYHDQVVPEILTFLLVFILPALGDLVKVLRHMSTILIGHKFSEPERSFGVGVDGSFMCIRYGEDDDGVLRCATAEITRYSML